MFHVLSLIFKGIAAVLVLFELSAEKVTNQVF